MKFLRKLFLSINFLSSLTSVCAENFNDRNVVMNRLLRENWLGGIETKSGKTALPKSGDILFKGLENLISEVLIDRDLKRTTFVSGDTDRPMVEIEVPVGTNEIIFRFKKDDRENESINTLIPRVGALVSACYFRGIEDEVSNIKELTNSSKITKDQALILLLNYDYQSIKFTYDFYKKFAVPWSASVDVDPILWKADISFPFFLQSKHGKSSKDRWTDWLAKEPNEVNPKSSVVSPK